jgi:hypothetical protein
MHHQRLFGPVCVFQACTYTVGLPFSCLTVYHVLESAEASRRYRTSDQCRRGGQLHSLLSCFKSIPSQIFLIYTALNQKPLDLTGPDGFRGLGHVDSRKDTLSIRFELAAPSKPTSSSGASEFKLASRSRKSVRKAHGEESPHVIEIELAQDKTALRSRKGDTGSVLWRAR